MTKLARQILALFVLARRQHNGLSSEQLEAIGGLKAGSVERCERLQIVNKVDRLKLAGYCKIEQMEGLL